jgi:hypothetical protein
MSVADRHQFAAAWPRGRAAALAGVTIVHALVIGLWLQQRQVAREAPAVGRVLQLVVLPLRQADPAPAPSAPAPPSVAPRERRVPGPTPTAAPEAITLPAAPPAPEPSAITAEPPRPPASAAGLNLALPRAAAAASAPWRAVDAVRRQLQPEPPPGQVEASIGRLTENDGTALREESLGDGRTRVRGRGGCVEVHEAGMARIDPFNKSVQPLPGGATPCRGDPKPRRRD